MRKDGPGVDREEFPVSLYNPLDKYVTLANLKFAAEWIKEKFDAKLARQQRSLLLCYAVIAAMGVLLVTLFIQYHELLGIVEQITDILAQLTAEYAAAPSAPGLAFVA